MSGSARCGQPESPGTARVNRRCRAQAGGGSCRPGGTRLACVYTLDPVMTSALPPRPPPPLRPVRGVAVAASSPSGSRVRPLPSLSLVAAGTHQSRLVRPSALQASRSQEVSRQGWGRCSARKRARQGRGLCRHATPALVALRWGSAGAGDADTVALCDLSDDDGGQSLRGAAGAEAGRGDDG